MLIRHLTKHLEHVLWTYGQRVYSGTREEFLGKQLSLLSHEHAVIHHTTSTNQTTREYSLYIIIIIIIIIITAIEFSLSGSSPYTSNK